MVKKSKRGSYFGFSRRAQQPRKTTDNNRAHQQRTLKQLQDFKVPSFGSPQKPGEQRSSGDYPSKRKFGDTIYPTVVDRWNFDGAWKRWKLGYSIYSKGIIGIIDNLNYFCEVALPAEVNQLKPSRANWQIGEAQGITELLELFYFPSTSEDGGYLTIYRRPNALALPFPIASQRVEADKLYVTLDGTIDDSFKGYIGDRLGDGLDSTGAAVPFTDVVSYLLVDVLGQELVFDLASARGAIEDSHYLYKTTRQFIVGRFLSTAPKIVCSCPDCLSAENKREFTARKARDRVPTNTVGSLRPSLIEDWENLYKRTEYRTWRQQTAISQAALNAPVIRACKHIYAIMFYQSWLISEPNDYPTHEKKEEIELFSYTSSNIARFLEFQTDFLSRRFIYLTPLIYTASIALNLPDEALFNSYFLLLPPGYYANPIANRTDAQSNPVFRFEQDPIVIDQQRTGTEITPLPVEQFNPSLPLQVQLKNDTGYEVSYLLRPIAPGDRVVIAPGATHLAFSDFTDVSNGLPLYFVFDVNFPQFDLRNLPEVELNNKLGVTINVAINPAQQTIFLQLSAKRTDPPVDIIYLGPDGKINETYYIFS